MKHSPTILLLALVACGYDPARFAVRGPVLRVRDDQPIALPRVREFVEDVYQADVYVRRELVNGLNPTRYPQALDVNSRDEVPTSSWYRGVPRKGDVLDDYVVNGPPRPPFTLSEEEPSSGMPGAIVITDARDLPYEIVHDPPERDGMRTTALAVASRLVHALGYRTPEVHIILSHEGRRAAAMRWPIGVDLGPTPMNDVRSDDPNDQLPHLDRRTLRVLYLVTAWFDGRRLRPRHLRDAYVGEDLRGHVQHMLVGLDGALGVDNYLDAVAFANNPDREDSNFFLRVFSAGLSPKPPGIMPETEWPGVGLMTENVLPDEWDMSPPFEPSDRMQPSDAYWIAKRMASVGRATLSTILDAAAIEAAPRKWLFQRLSRRRTQLIGHGYDQVTPCDVVGSTATRKGGEARLRIIDRALFQGIVPLSQRSYRVRYLDGEGEPIAVDRGIAATGASTWVPVPASLKSHEYIVVQIVAMRGGAEMPRPLEVHLVPLGRNFRVIGVQH